uniref:Uncharacterized protein n=1 Tax=Vitis vinifera TaxID=29760 RepID=F6HJX9_VITVI
MSTPFRLVPEAASVQAATVESSIFPHYSVRTPFVFIPDVDEVQTPCLDCIWMFLHGPMRTCQALIHP